MPYYRDTPAANDTIRRRIADRERLPSVVESEFSRQRLAVEQRSSNTRSILHYGRLRHEGQRQPRQAERSARDR